MSQINPLGSDVHLSFTAYDEGTDDIVEAGIDNVLIEADRQVCDPISVSPPNNVGDTLLADKTGADVALQWGVPVIDPTHDAAIFYKLYVSGFPEGGFDVKSGPFSPTVTRPLEDTSEYYLLSAVNGGGTSEENPD